MRSLVGLDILEAALGVANRVELLSRRAAVRGASYFSGHANILLGWLGFVCASVGRMQNSRPQGKRGHGSVLGSGDDQQQRAEHEAERREEPRIPARKSGVAHPPEKTDVPEVTDPAHDKRSG